MVLDPSRAGEIATYIVDDLEFAQGFTPEEIIPGLIQAIVKLAAGDNHALDEAANMLADGGLA